MRKLLSSWSSGIAFVIICTLAALALAPGAMTAPLETPARSQPPLYPYASWNSAEPETRTVKVNSKYSFTIDGLTYTSLAFNGKAPAAIVAFYLPESLAQLGWSEVGEEPVPLGYSLTYFQSPDAYLRVVVGACPLGAPSSQFPDYSPSDESCVSVWHGHVPSEAPPPEVLALPRLPAPSSTESAHSLAYPNPLTIPQFSQRDGAWSGDRQGWPDSGYPAACDFCTLGDYGCWTTSYAMLYSYYQPSYIDPKNLNNNLNTGPGGGPRYTSNGAHCNNYMPGGSPYAPSGVARGSSAYNNCTAPNCIDAGNISLIDNEINAGRPLLSYVHYSGVNPQHMVVIVGHSGSTYNIIDPWDGQQHTLASGASGAYVVDWIYQWTGTPSNPPTSDLRQSGDLRIYPNPVPGGQQVFFDFKVKNFGGASATIEIIGPEGTTAQNTYWKAFMEPANITLSPGEERTIYTNTIAWADVPGTWSVTRIPYRMGGLWFDLPANGYRQAQNFQVESPPITITPPTPTPTATPPSSCDRSVPGVLLYSEHDYAGRCSHLVTSHPDLGQLTVGDNAVSSVWVNGTYDIRLYEDRNYGGRYDDISHSEPNLDIRSLGEQYSSVRIRIPATRTPTPTQTPTATLTATPTRTQTPTATSTPMAPSIRRLTYLPLVLKGWIMR